MRKSILIVIFLSVLAIYATDTETSNKKILKETENTLLVFINPYGAPCQRQMDILEQNADSVRKYAVLKYIRTDVPEDREKFGKWGIRGLPTAIIANKESKELLRFAPGVQNGKTIVDGLRKVDGRRE